MYALDIWTESGGFAFGAEAGSGLDDRDCLMAKSIDHENNRLGWNPEIRMYSLLLYHTFTIFLTDVTSPNLIKVPSPLNHLTLHTHTNIYIYAYISHGYVLGITF